MNRLLIISDLWGARRSDWLIHYTEHLQHRFEVQYYDSCILGDIDTTIYEQEALHQQFVVGGIERALEQLLRQEEQATVVLAFSIGGIIAWKAIEQGLEVQGFYALSATRLRYETQAISAPTKLFYGALDEFRPMDTCLKQLAIPYVLFAEEKHDFYRKPYLARQISSTIIEDNE